MKPATIPQTRPPSESGDRLQARRLAQAKRDAPSRAKLFQRVYAQKASPRQCVKAFCLECNGYEEPAIRACTSTACPLFSLRPYQK